MIRDSKKQLPYDGKSILQYRYSVLTTKIDKQLAGESFSLAPLVCFPCRALGFVPNSVFAPFNSTLATSHTPISQVPRAAKSSLFLHNIFRFPSAYSHHGSACHLPEEILALSLFSVWFLRIGRRLLDTRISKHEKSALTRSVSPPKRLEYLFWEV